jgi:hypothetical protein
MPSSLQEKAMKSFKYLLTYANRHGDQLTPTPYWVEVNRPIEDPEHFRTLALDMIKPDTAITGFLGSPSGKAYELKLMAVSLLRAGDEPDENTQFKILAYSRVYPADGQIKRLA